MKNIIQLFCRLSRAKFLVCLIAAIILPVHVYALTVDGITYSLNSKDHTATLTKWPGASGDIKIPLTVEQEESVKNSVTGKYEIKTVTYTVTAISGSVFSNNTAITSVDFGNVTSIGSNAFAGCTNLYVNGSMTIPATVTKIEQFAFRESGIKELKLECHISEMPWGCFQNCPNLRSIKLPSGLLTIGQSAFAQCPNLEGLIDLPATLETIRQFAFQKCPKITGLSIKKGLKSIEYAAFRQSGIQVLDLPDAVIDLEIGNDAFCNCKALHTIKFKDSESIKIGNDCFYLCDILKTIVFAEGVKSIGSGAFKDCKILEDFKLPTTLTELAKDAFNGCNTLTRVDIPDSIPEIEERQFKSCVNLRLVTHGKKTRRIKESAFENCENLCKFWERKADYNPNNLEYVAEYNALMKGGKVSNSSAQSASPLLSRSRSSSDDGWIIDDRAFSGCKKLDELPANIISFGKYAFYDVPLTTPIFPAGMTVIPAYSFRNALFESVDIPGRIREIGAHAFDYCRNLTSLRLPANLKIIGEYAFDFCKLSEVVLPDGLEYIGKRAFGSSGNGKISSIVIPDSVKFIGESPFYYLGEITFGTPTLKNETGVPMLEIYENAFCCLSKGTTPTVTSYHTVPPAVTSDKEPEEGVMRKLFTAATYTNGILYVPAGCVDAYRAAEGWCDFANIVEIGSSSAIETVGTTNAKLSVNGGVITVTDAGDSTPVSVYNIAGTCLYQGTGNCTIPALPSGLYIIKISTRTHKIAL